MSIFADSTSDARISSVGDIGFDHSDMDTSSSSDCVSDAGTPKDYWFGLKYFECVLAQTVFQDSRLYESVASVDSRLKREIEGFPYAQALAELQMGNLEPILPVIEVDRDYDAYRVLMFYIGAIIRNGNREQKGALLAVLRQVKPLTVGFENAFLGSGPQHGVSTTTHPQRVDQSGNSDSVTVPELGRYATALKEYSDRQGLVPVYSIIEVSQVPPSFEASVMVDGSTYRGRARTKKQARHEAAKSACSGIGIRV